MRAWNSLQENREFCRGYFGYEEQAQSHSENSSYFQPRATDESLWNWLLKEKEWRRLNAEKRGRLFRILTDGLERLEQSDRVSPSSFYHFGKQAVKMLYQLGIIDSHEGKIEILNHPISDRYVRMKPSEGMRKFLGLNFEDEKESYDLQTTAGGRR